MHSVLSDAVVDTVQQPSDRCLLAEVVQELAARN
jgi:hypothetical protein